VAENLNVSTSLIARGTGAGCAGGLFAALFPIVTGGMGGLIAGHATAQRDERVFLISQGANKVIYYVGGLLLFFVPGLHLRRGGMAWMLSGFYTPYAPPAFYRAVAAAFVSGVLAFFLLFPLARLMMGLVARVDYRYLSAGVLLVLVLIVALTSGPAGLLIAAVGSGIGLIPVLWGARRMNCMGVLLLPLVLNLAGLGDNLAAWLGLL
jgi:putative membrane protein